MYLVNFYNVKTVISECLGSTLCCIESETEFVIFLCNVAYFALIGVSYGDEYTALFCHFIACRNQTFVKCFFQSVGNTQNFACRFHFGTKLVIHVDKLFKGEYRHFYSNVR